LSSSTSTSYQILTNLPPSVYHPLNVLAGTDSTSYNRLHYLPEWYITRYGWFAALLQYVAAGLLGDVAPYIKHAEEAVYIKGLETDSKLRGYDITLDRPDAGGQDRRSLDDQDPNRVYYLLYMHSVDPIPGPS
jgi:hypothetical protein